MNLGFDLHRKSVDGHLRQRDGGAAVPDVAILFVLSKLFGQTFRNVSDTSSKRTANKPATRRIQTSRRGTL